MRRTMAGLAALLLAGCGGDYDGAGEEGGGTVVQEQQAEVAAPEAPVAPAYPGTGGPVYDDPGVNAYVDTVDDPLSTFATDVDTASYALARQAVNAGSVPDPAGVRVEEFVNYFDAGYEPPAEDPFAIVADGAPARYATEEGAYLLRIGLQAREARAASGDVALTFVIDTSGSMADENRLALVQRALGLLVTELNPSDTVALVTFGDDARVVLPPTPAAERETLLSAIDGLSIAGSTNAEAGLRLGYELARETLRPGVENRVVLASDGIANVGLTDPESLLSAIREDAAAGIELVTVGVGVADYNDVLMEQLADDGDGFYAYVDSFNEAQRLFVERLGALTETVALDAKVQVEFEPGTVERYRLLGYENRDVADDRFSDPTVDAGLVSAGDNVTALYEIVPTAAAQDEALAEVRLHWTDADSQEARETAATVTVRDLAPDLAQADPHLQLAATAAAYAEVLRESPWTDANLDTVARDVDALTPLFPEDDEVAELADLVRAAAALR